MTQALALPTKRDSRSPFKALDISRATRKDYEARLPRFLQFVAQSGGLSINTFLDYKQYLESCEDLGVASKNKYLVVAKVYLREMHRRGLIPVDITTNVKTFKQSKKHKRAGLTAHEISKLCKWMDEDLLLKGERKYCRIRALIALLIFQGLRTIEICRLDWNDFDEQNAQLAIRGKGKDDKEFVPLHPKTAEALSLYQYSFFEKRQYESKFKTDTAALMRLLRSAMFVSYSNSSQHKRLSPRGLRSIIKPILTYLGIKKTVHGFRHFYTTTLIQGYDGNLLDVARYTRHKSLEMLQVYDDSIKEKADLPRYEQAFSKIAF
ncbi:tyrosine-type recombinase/integrase [Candidatus Berkelbacteria bacterium]|nr:tyrosine-type recombinase/integrase [Candidatus Berkelbacteria bacterium]